MSEYSNAILSDTPIVYYRCDEQSGIIATDSSGNGYDGVLQGVTTYGQTGAIVDDPDTALLMTALGTLAVPYVVNPTSWTKYTLELWMKLIFGGWSQVVITYDGTTLIKYLNGTPYAEVLPADTFARVNQSGFGTASDGETWTNLSGAGTLSIASNEGVATGNFGLNTFIRLGNKRGTDMNALVRLAITEVDNPFAGIALRITDANNLYVASINGGHVWLDKYVGGIDTLLTHTNRSFTSGQFYWMRFLAEGTALSVKLWPDDGSTEPTTWDLTVTDSDFVSGGFGLYNYSSSGGDHVQFDHFSLSNLGPVILLAQDLSYIGASNAATFDEIALYNQVLAPAQVAWHYQISLSGRSGIAIFPATTRRTGDFSATQRRGI